MQPDKFPEEVIERLGWYVYRLVDLRNGETFPGSGISDNLADKARKLGIALLDYRKGA